MNNKSIDVLTGDILDIRDIIKRYEELENVFSEERELTEEEKTAVQAIAATEDDTRQEEAAELLTLIDVLEKCKGNGGDEQWRGDWYPVTLIADDYFRTYAEELAEDIGAVNRNASWPNNYIDWDAASEALRSDYTAVTIDGSDYWTR